MIFNNSLTVDSVYLLVAFLAIVTVYYKISFQYWQRKKVPYLEPHIPLGSIKGIITPEEHLGVHIKHIYDEVRVKGWKHVGLYFLAKPIYMVLDLDYIKNVMTKDFHHFMDRGYYHNEKDDPLSANLFGIDGPKWRNLRTKFTPTFTSGKMKMMFQTLVDCEVSLRKKMEQESTSLGPIDIKEILGCFTTNIIGSCAFGLDCNTFEDEKSPFRAFGRKVFEKSFSRNLRRSFTFNFPKIARFFRIPLLPKNVSDFFINIVKETIEHREKNGVSRKDFMQLLINMKNNQSTEGDGTSLTIEEIAAQSFVFFVAGFETSATTMTFALYELAKHDEIQEKVRKEINEVLAKYDGQITYEGIQEMKYMGQVLDETLRKYPPGPFLMRKCTKDYKIPDSDTIIEKDTTVIIPVLGIHYNEDIYPDPKKFDPDRFTEKNKNSRHSYAYLPFGEGPRNCIGMRFGLMQAKVGLTSMLKSFKFTVNAKTQEPLKMKPSTVVLAPQGEIWFNIQKIP